MRAIAMSGGRRRGGRRASLAASIAVLLVCSGCNLLGGSNGSGGSNGAIVTVYDPGDVLDSRMYLMDGWNVDDVFRTGAGNGTNVTCNAQTGPSDPNGGGPAPVGSYAMSEVPYHSDSFHGSAIYGRVWRMEDKACPDGTPRTALFIHSEETPSATQGSIESQQWNGTGDYVSHGCWKVARSNNGGDNGVGRLDGWFHGMGGQTGVPYSAIHSVVWGP